VRSQGVIQCTRGEKGDGRQRPGGEKGIDSKQNDSDAEKLKEGDQALFDSIDQHSLHVHHVLTDTGEQISAGTVIVPRGRKALKGGVKIPSKIENHLLLKKIIEEDSESIQPVAAEKNDKEKSDQPRKPVSLPFGDDIIDQNSREAGIN
jgi:hypothetical protein